MDVQTRRSYNRFSQLSERTCNLSLPKLPNVSFCEPRVAVAGKPVQCPHKPITWASLAIINECNLRSRNRDPEHSIASEELNPIWNSLQQIVVFHMFEAFLTARPAGVLSASLAVKFWALAFGHIQDIQCTCQSTINRISSQTLFSPKSVLMLSFYFPPSLVSGFFPRDLFTKILWAFVVFRILVTRNVVLIGFEVRIAYLIRGNDTMRPPYHFEPKCSIKISTREEWNKGSRPPPVLQGLVWYTNGLRTRWGARAGVFWRSWRRIAIQQFSRPRFALS
jgi:uncharacterized membrane protein (DUF485 family)